MKPSGPCPCGGAYENRLVEVSMDVNDEAVVLPAVPQGVCPSCGSLVYRADTLARLELLLRDVPLVITS